MSMALAYYRTAKTGSGFSEDRLGQSFPGDSIDIFIFMKRVLKIVFYYLGFKEFGLNAGLRKVDFQNSSVEAEALEISQCLYFFLN